MIKIKLVLPPSKEMYELAMNTFKEHNESNKFEDANKYELEIIDATDFGINNAKVNGDVIITRGISLEILKNDENPIPFVEIPLTGNDLTIGLCEYKKRFGYKKVAILGPKDQIYGIEKISDLVGLELKAYPVNTWKDTEKVLEIALKDGCQTIYGGHVTCEIGQRLGMDTIILPIGKESFWKAFSDAKRIAQISRREQEKTELFKTILDYAMEGVIAVDKKKRISVFNEAARKILDIELANAIGKEINEVLPESILRETLLESELFGYVGGAFTDAAKEGKAGVFELAHKGTIFLDEIAGVSLNLQSRLLRVIEEREIIRLGHDRVIPVDVRIISATNKDLYTMA